MKVICERALNFEKIVFYLLVLLLPTQFGKHFWPAFSQVLGIRVDYLSPALHVTDLVILVLFFLWLKRLINHTRQVKAPNDPSYYLRLLTCHSRERGRHHEMVSTPAVRQHEVHSTLVVNPVDTSNASFIKSWKVTYWLIFFLHLLLNIFFSNNPTLGLYGFIKILELFFLGYYVSENIKTKKEFGIIAVIFSVSVIAESILAIAQYIHQGSLNGFLYFLGERKFTSLTPGIANASINGELILRPYGTFPHPNVLAGFLLCSLIIIFSWFDENKFILSICHSGKRSASRILTSRDSGQARMTALYIMNKILKIIALLLGSLALLLTLSRVAIILWIILAIIALSYSLFPRHSRKRGRPHEMRHLEEDSPLGGGSTLVVNPVAKKNFSLFIIIIFISLLFFTPVLSRFKGTNFTGEAFSQRAELFKSTLIMIKDHPLFGVGLHNFLPSLSHIQKPLSPALYLQPVHNIFLLITAEIGIIGFAFFLWFMYKTYNRLLFFLSLRDHEVGRTKEPACLTGEEKQSPSVLLILLSVILILGLFDHYWLTLQQGQLLFALILGLCWAL